MDAKWFTVSMAAFKISTKRSNRKTYLGSSPIRDVFAKCRGGRSREQQGVVLQRQKNDMFKEAVVRSWLDTAIWWGTSVEEVEAEILKLLLEKYLRRDQGWRDHTVVARQLSCDEMDEIARTHLQPVLDKYEVMKRR